MRKKRRKWEITGLKPKLKFSRSAHIALSSRFDEFSKQADKYLKEESVESLHQLRISLRRIRYSIEIFVSCFDKKLWNNIYKKIEHLQDITGELRDLDVMLENLNCWKKEKIISIPDTLINNIAKKRLEFNSEVKNTVVKFLGSKPVRQFQKYLIDKERGEK